MSTNPTIMPVGKDCDCGHPMVWRLNEQRCAVYGQHLTPLPRTGTMGDDYLFVIRDMNAPLADVVDELDAMTVPTGPRGVRPHRVDRGAA